MSLLAGGKISLNLGCHPKEKERSLVSNIGMRERRNSLAFSLQDKMKLIKKKSRGLPIVLEFSCQGWNEQQTVSPTTGLGEETSNSVKQNVIN